ncbi:MAG: ABC transporter substrate-binding protein [Acidimicrobiia bacterium]|nr:ABC transporter substrate-binding protein [Acidimicrobiia bacterium]
MSNRSWSRLLALLLVFGLVAAACGSDSDSGSGDGDDSAQTDEATDDADGADGTADDSGSTDDEGTEVTVAPETDDPVAGGTLRYGLIAEVDGLNPTTSALAPSGLLMGRAIFDTLAAIDSNDQWVPKLAESFTANEDSTEWTMTLREGVTFHDGTPLDAEAVVFNFEKQRNDQLVGNAIRPYYVEDNPIEIIDPLTVKYNLDGGGNTEWPLSLATQLGMMGSPAWLEAAEADESLNQQPVGAGSFAFESRSQDAQTRVVRNDDYYGGDVWLDAIEFFPITDGAQRADQLLGGAIDALMTTDSPSAQRLIDEEDATGAVRNILDDTGDESFVMMNSAAAPFDDVRVRQALTLSTPRQAYNTRISEGINRLADQMFTPESPYFNPDVVQEGDDPDAAAPLVAEYCGEFPDNCLDGKVNMEYQHAGPSAQQTRIADLLSEGWSEHFNVNVSEVLQDDLVLNAALGNYQVNTWRQFGAVNPYQDRVWIACETVGPISLNWPRLCDEQRTDLIDEGMASPDQALKEANMKQISVTMNEAYTYVFLNHSQWDNAFAENVRAICDAETLEGVALRCTENGRHFFEHIWMAS